MTMLTIEKTLPGAPEGSPEGHSHSFHVIVGEVDAKVKIVAIGQPSEAVNVFCTQSGGHRHAWDAIPEAQAQNLLELIRQAFSSEEYKAIPLMAHNCAGLKVHRACQGFDWASRRNTARPSGESLEIFNQVCRMLENLAYNPEAVYALPTRMSRYSFHSRMAEQALRNEISRIIGSASQMDSKVNSIVRLIDRHSVH